MNRLEELLEVVVRRFKMTESICNKEKSIKALVFSSGEYILVNEETKVVPYVDYGVIWFEVYVNDKLVKRVNSAYVESVHYK